MGNLDRRAFSVGDAAAAQDLSQDERGDVEVEVEVGVFQHLHPGGDLFFVQLLDETEGVVVEVDRFLGEEGVGRGRNGPQRPFC